MRQRTGILVVAILASGCVTAAGQGLDRWQTPARTAVDRGLAFLASTQQPDGGWVGQSHTDPAITALVAKCFLQDPAHGPEHQVSRRAIRFILQHVQPDGGIYLPDVGLRNYSTSVCLMALSVAGDARHRDVIGRAQAFLADKQWDESEDVGRDNPWYGGAGYGKHKRPDLSNTQMMLEALHQSGLSHDDPAFQKALVFVSRSQMISETNDRSFARGSADGGFIYTPANGGESKAGTVVVNGQQRLRSYGSMTYAGFKSLLYAGLGKDDSRVKAAWAWISDHYTLDENPNMPGAASRHGLFYYYHVFARALHAYGRDEVLDRNGVLHPWRRELCEKLAALQRDDGSWVNSEDRWYEGNPYLVTAYAILAVQTAAR